MMSIDALNQVKVPPQLRWHLAFCLCLPLVFGCGCRKGSSSPANGTCESGLSTNASGSVRIGPVEKSFEEMGPGDVLISVNGAEFKRSEYDAILNRMEKTYAAAHPRAARNEVLLYRKIRSKTMVNEYLVKQLLLQEARRRKLAVTPESKAKTDELLEKRAKFEGKSVNEYLSGIGPSEAAAVQADLDEQALILTLRESLFGDRLTIKDSDLQAARERVAKYNRMCEATNALVKAHGMAICERLRKGDDFSSVADAETENHDDGAGGFWGEFARGEIEDAAVRHAAFTLPVGAVSDPIDTEEGLMIIKVLDRKGLDSPVAATGATVKLARIVLRLGEFKSLPGDAELRKELERTRLTELQGGLIRELRQNATLIYPNGTNFWKKAKK